jgi:hypothetical protein
LVVQQGPYWFGFVIIVINYALGDPAVAYLVMSNPISISWTFEMFGYAVLGVATWLIAPTFRDARHGRLISGCELPT